MAPVGACTAIISFCLVKIVQVFFRLNNQTVCYVSKTGENTLPSWDCLYGSRKIENPVKCSACAVNQKIVTARFSGNALISTEPLVRIS